MGQKGGVVTTAVERDFEMQNAEAVLREKQGSSLSYHISFASCKEEVGFHNENNHCLCCSITLVLYTGQNSISLKYLCVKLILQIITVPAYPSLFPLLQCAVHFIIQQQSEFFYLKFSAG